MRPREVDEYLLELERALRDVPGDRRDEILTGIEAHIDALLAEHGPTPSEADVRNVLERVGRPDEIAREARDEADGRADPASGPRRWTDVAALVALPLPLIGWLVGSALLWMSDVWSTRDKIIGTLAGPAALFIGGLASIAASNRSSAFEQHHDGSGGLGPYEALSLTLLLLIPLAAAIYLARKLPAPAPGSNAVTRPRQ